VCASLAAPAAHELPHDDRDVKHCIACDRPVSGAGWRCETCGCNVPHIDGFLALAPDLARTSRGGFDAREFAALAAVEQNSFWFRGRNRLILWALARYCSRARTFCEIGCGTGFVLQAIATAFPRLALSGSEVSVSGLAYAARRVPRATLYQMDATRIPFVEEFDAIGAFDVLEHIEDDRRAIEQVLRALRPGGQALVTVPQHRVLWSEEDVTARHHRRYARTELEDKLRQAGFRIELRTSFVCFLLPAMLVSRLAMKKRRTGAFSTELNLPRTVDAAFQATLDAERMLIAAGVRLPVGGSQLVVASKPG
jgi:SAM-dependent methyltransferase